MHNPDLMLSILCAQRLCASSVMHDSKNTVNLILDFCSTFGIWDQTGAGPDRSATHVPSGIFLWHYFTCFMCDYPLLLSGINTDMGGVFCGCPEYGCFDFGNPRSGWVVMPNAQIRVVTNRRLLDMGE